jgi:hypothetical protein
LASIDKPHSKFPHVYAVARIDTLLRQSNPENCISVVKVFAARALAEKEVSRLRELNKGKGCLYFVYTTRMVS